MADEQDKPEEPGKAGAFNESLIRGKVRRADLLVINGLEGDQWVEAVVQGASNPRVLPGQIGYFEGAAQLVLRQNLPRGASVAIEVPFAVAAPGAAA